jgi:SnoaL-like domain
MKKNEFNEMLKSLADAWKQRDYQSAANFFDTNVRYGDPLRYSWTDRAKLLAFFEADEGYPQSTVWHNVLFDEDQQIGAAEYTYQGTHRYHGIVLIRIKDGKITNWREYQHIDPREWKEFISGLSFNSDKL